MAALGTKLRTLEGGLLGFWCPGCESMHAVRIGHASGDNWTFNGDGDTPTFSPSVLVRYRHPKGYTNKNPAPLDWDGEYVEDICHSFVTAGRIQFLADCTHALAGQTLELPDFP